jgi:hypothetical protein
MARPKLNKTKPKFESFKDQRDLYAPTKVSRRKVVFETSEKVLRAYADQLDGQSRVLFLLERGLDASTL